jgi:small ligand-binding sensory domain FIST
VSEHPVASTAVGEVVGQVIERGGARPDLALLFATGAHTERMDDITAAVRSLLSPATLVGATAVSVIGGPQEVEERPGLSLWAGHTGPVRPLRLDAIRDGESWNVVGLPDDLSPDEHRTVLLVTDPFTFPVEAFVDALGDQRPNLTVLGGIASAARTMGGNRLVLDGTVHDDGAVGVLLPPGLVTRPVVSQGCRPVGDPFIVTKATGNLLEELGGRSALDRLQQLLDTASPEDHALLARGLHIGIVIDERKETYGRGDFLVRNVVGADRSRGALAVGDEVEVGTTVQFHVRDAATADEDLRALLLGPPARSALLFTCNGRGVRLFGEPDHDASLVHAATGRGAVAGMFCAGELGPIGDRTFLHGFTASVLLFE